MTFQALRGTVDLLGPALTRWTALERTARDCAARYGYQELRTPILEESALFLRSIGETTDIVQKEMFVFKDRGDRMIVLRPEGTSAIVRAYLEHNLHKTQGQAKVFYLGPMFRAERPQAGRFRQFHQFGAEAIGSRSPWIEAEVVALCVNTLTACGLTDWSLWISSMGCRDDQARSAEQLRQRLAPHRAELCNECESRFDKNVFRVLDCKNPRCHELAWSFYRVPGSDHIRSPFLLCAECQAHFDQVREALRQIDIPFDDTKVFARGLDYYTRTVFEVKAQGIGSQDSVAAGGRYDHLVEELGGPPTGAIGFAAGIERVLAAIKSGDSAEGVVREGLYVAVVQPSLIGDAFRLVQRIRARGVTVLMDYEGRSLKAQLREADKFGCRWVAVFGEAERQQGRIGVKDLEQGKQEDVPFDQLAEAIAARQLAKTERQAS